MIVDLAIMVAGFALATVAALLLGAPNTGTAMTFGLLAFVAAATYSIVKRR